MSKSKINYWVWFAIILSIIVAVVGFPAFQKKYSFPESLIWTIAAVSGVWLTYFIRSWAFSSKHNK